MKGGLLQIFDESDPLRSDTTILVAALLTLGIAPVEGTSLFHCTYEQVRGSTEFRSVWTLRPESRDQRFDTRKMEAAWDSQPWLVANPSHPLAVIRSGLTFDRTFNHTPRFTLAELARIETPDTWVEAAMRNLVFLLREIPRADPRGIVRFGPRFAAMVPRSFSEAQKARFLRFVEHPDQRPQIRAA